MSFLKSEDEEPQTSFVTKGDAITLLVIALLAAGGYYYFQWAREASIQKVKEAQEVFATGDYVKALQAFDDLEGLSWKSDSLDSIIYETHSIIEDRRSNQKFIYGEIVDHLEKGDSNRVHELLTKMEGEEFLKAHQVKQLKEWREIFILPQDSLVVDSIQAEK